MINTYIQNNHIVPYDVIDKYLRNELQKEKYHKGIIIDGYLINNESYEFINQLLNDLHFNILLTIYLAISYENVLVRLSNTSTTYCSECRKYTTTTTTLQPKMDNICDNCQHIGLVSYREINTETFQKQVNDFDTVTGPMIARWNDMGLLYTIDATLSPTEITYNIMNKLKSIN
jgi:adenylate kinase family enzyme